MQLCVETAKGRFPNSCDVLPNVVHMLFFVPSLAVDFQNMSYPNCAMYFFSLANDSMAGTSSWAQQCPGRSETQH